MDVRAEIASVQEFFLQHAHRVDVWSGNFWSNLAVITSSAWESIVSSCSAGQWPDRRSVLCKNVDSTLERQRMVQRCELHAVYPCLLLVLFNAEIVHGLFKTSRFSQTAQLKQILGTASHMRLTVTQAAVVQSTWAFDRVISASSDVWHLSLVWVLRVET